MLICKTPLRVSLFGGGTDFPIWFRKYNGMTISLSIDKYCYVTLRHLPPVFPFKYRLRYFKTETVNKISEIKHPSINAILNKYNLSNNSFEISHSSDIPGLSGLGSSSAFTVSLINLINTYNKIKLSKKDLSKKAIFIEREVLKESVGFQDQYSCSYGGFNVIKYSKKNVSVNSLRINNKNKKLLIKNCLIVYSGIQRKAEPIEKDKIKNIYKNEIFFYKIYQTAQKAKKIMESNSTSLLDEIGGLMNESWSLKRNLSKKVSNSKIDNLYNFGMNNGAIGAKLLGAGGGGYIIFLSKNQYDQNRLIKKLKKKIYFKLDQSKKGSEIIYNSWDYK